MKKTTALFLICVLILGLSACGGSKNEVPRSVLSQMVESSQEFTKYDINSWTAAHNVDTDAHTDIAIVTMMHEAKYGQLQIVGEAAYRYDRTSDIWSLMRAVDWAQPTYSFTSALEKEWNVETSGTRCKITITKVSGSSITLQCSSVADYGRYKGITLECSGTYQISGRFVDVPMSVPGSSTTVDMSITLSVDDGVLAVIVVY